MYARQLVELLVRELGPVVADERRWQGRTPVQEISEVQRRCDAVAFVQPRVRMVSVTYKSISVGDAAMETLRQLTRERYGRYVVAQDVLDCLTRVGVPSAKSICHAGPMNTQTC